MSKHRREGGGAARLCQWILAVLALVLAGCSMVGADAKDPTPPAGAVWIRVHTNGGERFPESVRWRFRSVGAADHWGVVTHIPEATCIVIGPQWGLEVTTDQGGQAVLRAAAADRQFSRTSPLDLAITRDDGGEIIVTEGLPDWWVGRPIGCASE